MIKPNARLRGERAAKFVALAVIACKTKRVDFANTQSNEVIQHRSRSTRLGANVHNIMHGQSCFERNLAPREIDLQISIETKISNHCNGQFRISPGDGSK